MSGLILPEQKSLIVPEKKLILPEKKFIQPEAHWAPLYYSAPLSDRTRGDAVIEFAETILTYNGKPLRLTDWQKWAIRIILEEDKYGWLRYRRFILEIARKNGKSWVAAVIVLYFLLFSDEHTQIFSLATDREQAKIVLDVVKGQIKSNRSLSKYLKIYRDAIRNIETGGFYKAASSDGNSLQGYNPTLVIFDEGHAFKKRVGEELWSAATEGSGNKDESLAIILSTAGDDMDGFFGVQHETALKNLDNERNNRTDFDDSLGIAYWGAPEEADIEDEQVWHSANPNLALGILKIKSMRKSLAAGKAQGNLSAFKRFRLNQWVRTDGQNMYITPFHWKQAEVLGGSIKKGEAIAVGFDGSVSDDDTVLVGISIETGMTEILAKWSRDYSNPDWTVPREEVLEARKRIFEEYDVKKMWCDPSFFQTDVDIWARQTRGVVERIPQSTSRMAPLTQQLKIDLISKDVKHNGDPELRRYFFNAVESQDGKIYKEARGSKNKIDAAVATVLANGARNKVLRRASGRGRAITL